MKERLSVVKKLPRTPRVPSAPKTKSFPLDQEIRDRMASVAVNDPVVQYLLGKLIAQSGASAGHVTIQAARVVVTLGT